MGNSPAHHPYLLFRRSALPGIRRSAAVNPQLQARVAQVLAEIPPAAAQEPRTALKRRARRLINIAFLALTAKGSSADAALAATRSALAEFAAAASWNERPVIRSFLDRGEIAVAVALAYDWLYDRLAPQERRAIENAILRNVLEPAYAAYADPSLLWPKRRDNCTLVSNSAITIAALAVLRRYPELSARLVHRSLASAWNVFAGLAPDGAWREGLSYWSLAMRYAGLMVAALESTLATALVLLIVPASPRLETWSCTRWDRLGRPSISGIRNLASMCRRSPGSRTALAGRSTAGCSGRRMAGICSLQRFGRDRQKACPMTLGLPTGKVFHSADLACFRNTWSREPSARPVYLAIKGGNVSARSEAARHGPEDVMLHAQADAGTFILDGARHRWIIELGSDDYDLPGYFDHGSDTRSGPRWRYYRSQAAGHNTLTIGGRDQVPNAPARIVGSCVEGDCKWVVLDLSAAYDKPAGTVRRGAALIGRQVVIQDEVDPDSCSDIIWVTHTSAEPVQLAGSLARFRYGRAIGSPPASSNRRAPASSWPPRRRRVRSRAARRTQLHGRADRRRRPFPNCPAVKITPASAPPGRLSERLQIAWPAGTRRLSVLLLPDCDGTNLHCRLRPSTIGSPAARCD